jgi:hypothetical protein
MISRRTPETARPKLETARHRPESARHTPRRNAGARRDDDHGYRDQGIRKDERGQKQPTDKKREIENR